MTTHHNNSDVDLKAGRRRVARSRGALSGILLIVLGAWAALVPFIGPYFSFGIEPNSGDAFHWTVGRGVYELLPGAVAVLAGIVLLISASRTATLLFAWLATLSGAWLVVGFTLDIVLNIDDRGLLSLPQGTTAGKAVAIILLYFLGTGVAIAIIGGTALGRLSVHSIRDVRAAERRADDDADAAAQPVQPVAQQPVQPVAQQPVQPVAQPVAQQPTATADGTAHTAPHDGHGGAHAADAPARYDAPQTQSPQSPQTPPQA